MMTNLQFGPFSHHTLLLFLLQVVPVRKRPMQAAAARTPVGPAVSDGAQETTVLCRCAHRRFT